MKQAVLGLGCNLGDCVQTIRDAITALGRLPGTQVVRSSHFYRTKPVGLLDQPDFVNAAALIETDLTARALLGACLGIEAAQGRVRGVKNGPRVLDIDLLLYEGVKCGDAELTLPHPRMHERAFVLVPLSDLFPDLKALGMDLRGMEGWSGRQDVFAL